MSKEGQWVEEKIYGEISRRLLFILAGRKRDPPSASVNKKVNSVGKIGRLVLFRKS